MIQKDTFVSISYIMRNSRGKVLEKKTISYLHGSPAISPILQAQLEGLRSSESAKIFLKKGQENADDDFSFDVTVNTIREAAPPKIHLLSGFLGSGKTTAIHQACRLLAKQNIPAAVITNDQGSRLVDGDLFTHLGVPSGQVTNGCFCCHYDDLDAAIHYLLKHDTPSVIFAESVGSCTDLVATVLKPLLQRHPEWRTTATTFADAQLITDGAVNFDETVGYIFNKQLEEAKVIVVSKIDLLETATQLQARLQSRFPDKTILYQDSFNEEHIARWLQTLDTVTFKDARSLDIDYDIYGLGEAKLAWLDQQLEIISPNQRARQSALALIAKIAEISHPIGHLKFLLDNHIKISITATGAADYPEPQPAATATLLINARIQTEPATLSQFVHKAIETVQRQSVCTIRTISESCFQPGYPRPTHRLP